MRHITLQKDKIVVAKVIILGLSKLFCMNIM